MRRVYVIEQSGQYLVRSLSTKFGTSRTLYIFNNAEDAERIRKKMQENYDYFYKLVLEHRGMK